ncbi:hypothetical protein [Marinifilum sp.]|uniref:hypothetical protein n=1 Tax=Marinifilum sp. TaxID=2033137 RepID=UPI003BA9464E
MTKHQILNFIGALLIKSVFLKLASIRFGNDEGIVFIDKNTNKQYHLVEAFMDEFDRILIEIKGN